MTAKSICADCRFAEWDDDRRFGTGRCAWRPNGSAAAALGYPRAMPIARIPGLWGYHQSCPVYERKSDDLPNPLEAEMAANIALMDAARLEERAKIVAYLRDETQIMAATVQAQNTLLEAAAKIEAGRHLK